MVVVVVVVVEEKEEGRTMNKFGGDVMKKEEANEKR